MPAWETVSQLLFDRIAGISRQGEVERSLREAGGGDRVIGVAAVAHAALYVEERKNFVYFRRWVMSDLTYATDRKAIDFFYEFTRRLN